MLHTANIGAGLPPVDITFNCSDPANSVSGTYNQGVHTDADSCSTTFVSATVAGVLVAVGVSTEIMIGAVTAIVTVSTQDSGRHITVEVDLGR